jgi:hypothetical protein
LHDILGRSGITNNPKRNPIQSAPEVMHKLRRTFFVPSAELPKEWFIWLLGVGQNNTLFWGRWRIANGQWRVQGR